MMGKSHQVWAAEQSRCFGKKCKILGWCPALEERSEVLFRCSNFVILVRNDRNFKKGLS